MDRGNTCTKYQINRCFLESNMHELVKILGVITACSLFIFLIGFGANLLCSKPEAKKAEVLKIDIIVGSVRYTSTGRNIAENIKKIVSDRTDVVAQIIFVDDFHLPFYTSEISPDSLHGKVSDPDFQAWSDCVTAADAFIIVSPEYNGGYPASLKNALDSLYQEWNHKPVGFVGYSGGLTGGTNSIAQLKQVVERLEMIPVATSITIPSSWKAFDEQGNLIQGICQQVDAMVDELIKNQNK